MRELIAVGVLVLLVLVLAYLAVRWAERWWRDSDDAWPVVARVLRGINRDGLRPERVALVLVQALAAVGIAVAVAVAGASVLPSVVVIQLALAVVMVDATRGERRAQRVRSSVIGVLALGVGLAWTTFCVQWSFAGGELLAAFGVLLGGLAVAALTGWADGLAHRWTARTSGRRRPMTS